jgi:hypothetical protein
MGKAEVNKKRTSRKAGRRGLRGVLLLCAGLLGWYLGFRLPEERKNRARKLVTEAREMPFRIFV